MKRALLGALVAAALGAGVVAPGASAGTECEGLPECIRVVGPWVSVPAGPLPTYFRVRCPGPGQTVGGLDADFPRGGGGVDVTFLGALGGPVGPGITTGRDVVFVAFATRPQAGTFRPLLGCIPASGGGGRSRTSYEPIRRLAVVAPAAVGTMLSAARGPTLTRRVKTVRLREGARQAASHSCRPAERLLSFSTAIAFRTRTAPPTAQLASIRATARRAGGRVLVTVRGRPPAGVRVELQIHAVCVR
ncbi:MAG: hypothetical protein MSC30_09620 [Gaiellaceae bacterium MAG52_C11]|nr:hypothetical protein [Candidatus Gaiellasilicea maunaloa]